MPKKPLREITEDTSKHIYVNSVGSRYGSYVVHAAHQATGLRVGQHLTQEQIDSHAASKGLRAKLASSKEIATKSTPKQSEYHVTGVGTPEQVFHVVSVGSAVSKDHAAPNAKIGGNRVKELKKLGYTIKHP